MPELQRVRSDHELAILAFELENRAYFAGSITDRGDQFYERFSAHHQALLAEQDAGVSVFRVLVDHDATVLGRFNLYRLTDGSAEVGYRVARRTAGRGLATSGLRDLCDLAKDQHGLRSLTAKTTETNHASRRVLEKAGFVPVGSCLVAGQPGVRYERELAVTR